MKFIYGQENYLINREVKKLVANSEIQPIYHNQDSTVEEIVMDISTISLFEDSKFIIIKNHPVLSQSDTRLLLGAISNVDDSVSIIFTLNATPDKKNEIVKYLLATADCKEFNKLSQRDIIPTIKDIVKSKGGSISNSAAIKLASKVPNELRIFITEIEKLLNEDIEITDEMVEVSIGEYLKTDTYALSNAIIDGDAHAIMRAYKDKVDNDEDPTVIISGISSVLNLALKVSFFKRQGLSSQDISDKTKVHIFRIKKSLELVSSTDDKELEQLILDLAKLDKDIKTGLVDKEKGLEYFLLKLIR